MSESSNLPNMEITKSFSIVAIEDLKMEGFKSPDFSHFWISNSKANLFSLLLDIASIKRCKKLCKQDPIAVYGRRRIKDD